MVDPTYHLKGNSLSLSLSMKKMKMRSLRTPPPPPLYLPSFSIQAIYKPVMKEPLAAYCLIEEDGQSNQMYVLDSGAARRPDR